MRLWLALVLLLPIAAARPLIVGVVPQMPGGGDGGVAIASDVSIDLAGYTLSDGEGTWTFPPGTNLVAGQTLWTVSDIASWIAHQGGSPNIQWSSGQISGKMQLADGGDSVTLRDPAGEDVDSFAWGTVSAVGSQGKLPGATPGLAFKRDIVNGVWTDSGQSSDWVTPRMHRIGESYLDQPTFTVHKLTLYASPDSSFSTITSLLGEAQNRIVLHVYQLRSIALVDAVVAAKQAHPGLDLQVFVDDNPVGMTAPDRHATSWALQRIQDVGGHVVMAGNGRYDDFHLKVLIVDDAVAVQSENWVENGVPQNPTVGNRGWGAIVWDKACTQWFANWLQADRTAWDTHGFNISVYDPMFETPSRTAPRTGAYGPLVGALELTGDFQVTPIVSPDHTQDPRADPLAKLIGQAKARVDTEQLDLATGASNSLGWSSADPFIAAIGNAANRAVLVRVIAATPFAGEKGNQAEFDWLANAAPSAQSELIDRPGIETLHNKGLVVDDEVVLGSMNGNHHSRSANREVDLRISGPGVANYYEALFASDWSGKTASPDWSVIGKDIKGLPAAPFPTLLLVFGVALLAARSRP